MSEVPPTRMNLGVYKGKSVAAKKGFDLLKSKADALKVRFRDICKVIYDTKNGMSALASEAYFGLTQAEYAAGNFRNKILESNMSASVRVNSKTDNVAGVKLPVFNQYDTGAAVNENLGLVAGGRKITACKDKFAEYLKTLVKIASLQTSFLAMDEALKITNRRVNALENVTIPKIVGIISYINRELDELEREDFTRLKMVKAKKEFQAKSIEKEKVARLRAEQEEARKKRDNDEKNGGAATLVSQLAGMFMGAKQEMTEEVEEQFQSQDPFDIVSTSASDAAEPLTAESAAAAALQAFTLETSSGSQTPVSATTPPPKRSIDRYASGITQRRQSLSPAGVGSMSFRKEGDADAAFSSSESGAAAAATTTSATSSSSAGSGNNKESSRVQSMEDLKDEEDDVVFK